MLHMLFNKNMIISTAMQSDSWNYIAFKFCVQH